MQWKCVITGFEPFGNEATNPSWEAVKTLPDQIGNMKLIKQQIRTVFGECFESVKDILYREEPQVVICVGQAGGRAGITIEKVAINLMDARIPDNLGNQPIDRYIIENAPTAYFSTLPIRNMIMAMREGGVPANVSYTAGTYVCNDVMYRLLHDLQEKECIGGFIHVPYATYQGVDKGDHVPTMTIESMAKGLELGLAAIEMELKQQHKQLGNQENHNENQSDESNPASSISLGTIL